MDALCSIRKAPPVISRPPIRPWPISSGATKGRAASASSESNFRQHNPSESRRDSDQLARRLRGHKLPLTAATLDLPSIQILIKLHSSCECQTTPQRRAPLRRDRTSYAFCTQTSVAHAESNEWTLR